MLITWSSYRKLQYSVCRCKLVYTSAVYSLEPAVDTFLWKRLLCQKQKNIVAGKRPHTARSKNGTY